MKFEHVLALTLLIIIAVALFWSMYLNNQELIITFGTTLTAAFGGVIAFFFTRDKGDKPPGDK